MDIFFDTEFTQLNKADFPALLSIGCVAQNGREFYGELPENAHEERCSHFVIFVVLPLMQGGEYAMTELALAKNLQEWIESFAEDEVTLCSDSPPHDWRWVEGLFNQYHCWPKNLRRECKTIEFAGEQKNNAFEEGFIIFWDKAEAEEHHALWDARSLHFAWNYAEGVT